MPSMTRRATERSSTTINPLHLSITSGTAPIHVIDDGDLGVHVSAGKWPDGSPLRYDAQGGLVLVVLDNDGAVDEVHIQTGDVSRRNTILDTLQEAAFVIGEAVEALERVSKA